MNEEFMRLVGKAGALEILSALADKEQGLPYKTLEFDVVGRSSVYPALNAVRRFGLVQRLEHTYRVTDQGKEFLRLAKELKKLCPQTLQHLGTDSQRKQSSRSWQRKGK